MIINGTTYHDDTPPAVIRILEANRQDRRAERIIMEYGDTTTGKSWGKYGNCDEGYIGRSTGTIKIPLAIHNKRSLGGGGILDNRIIRITTARGKRVLYEHPTYQPADE